MYPSITITIIFSIVNLNLTVCWFSKTLNPSKNKRKNKMLPINHTKYKDTRTMYNKLIN